VKRERDVDHFSSFFCVQLFFFWRKFVEENKKKKEKERERKRVLIVSASWPFFQSSGTRGEVRSGFPYSHTASNQ
jgi:hypothetical protein